MAQGGQKLIASLTGLEVVAVDNGGPVNTDALSSTLANAPGPFGSSGQAGFFNRSGNLFTVVSVAGVSPAATGADKVLAVFSIPANSFDVAGRSLQIQAEGSFAGNGNTKEVKLFIGCTAAVVGQTVNGGTAIADSGAVTTNGGGWAIEAEVVKYGAAGSNTQLAVHQQAQLGGAVAALLAPQALTIVENAPILCAVTGNATTTATDIVFNFMQGFAQN